MSIRTTKPAQDEEARLRDRVEHFLVEARDLPDLDLDARIDWVERTATFLVEILLPHAAVEERVLYPEAALLLGEADASDSVASDRAAVRELIARLASADPGDPGALQEVVYALYALMSAHFWREEEVIVKLAGLPDEAGVHAVVDHLAEARPRERRFARGLAR
jgi:hypothetical protein